MPKNSHFCLQCLKIHISVYNTPEFKFVPTIPHNSNLRPQHIRIHICVIMPENSQLRLQCPRIPICVTMPICVYNASNLTFASTTLQNSYMPFWRHILLANNLRSQLLVMVSSHDSSLGSNAQICSPGSHISLTAISLTLTDISC